MILQLDPDSPIPPYEQLRGQRLATAARSFAVQARQLGVDPEQALRQARGALEALTPRAGEA